MIESGKNHIMPYLTAVADGYAAMILKMAAGIDEHSFPDIDILSIIGIEWRKYTERGRYFISEQFRQQFSYFVGCTVSSVQQEGDASCLIAHSVHETMDFFGVERIA